MTIRVGLHHHTAYRFDRAVGVGPHVVRLRPAPHTRTPIHRYSLTVLPEKHFINWQQDPFGNYLARLVFPEKARELSFTVDIVADMTVVNPFDFFLEESAERYPFPYDAALGAHLRPYLEVKEQGPRLLAWLAEVDRRESPTADFLVALNQRMEHDIAYSVRMAAGVQTCEETLGRAIGSCRDTGWLLVQTLRHLGLAARFVSGYLVQLTADVAALDGPSGTARDFTDLHAWTEVFLPGAGWVGLDPTSGLLVGEGHLPLACSPDPAGAAPITGATERTEVAFHFENRVVRIHEDPRVTKPYDEEAWRAIDALGVEVDRRLAAADVRLTMGGEPTFVSIDDMDGEEWTTAALGDRKWALSLDLAGRLAQRFAPGGVMHFGQGKWYPGEPVPRWAMTCYWRSDGEPLWRGPVPPREDPVVTAGSAEAEHFARTLATRLGVGPGAVLSGHEDVLHYLWQEGVLPANVDPLRNPLGTELDRSRLRRVLDGALGRPVGYALPLAWAESGWRSSRWRFRREAMFLIPGDSAMGYRLPLGALEWDPRAEMEAEPPRDPFAPRGPLPTRAAPLRREPGTGRPGSAAEPEVEPEPDPRGLVRTALCVEARAGVLYVFLPPLESAEGAIVLLDAVAATADAESLPVRIEGYPLPDDERVRSFQVTPDPGVIEVNVQPAASWPELVELTSVLHEEARLARLGTEKFMLDGRHTGTGGGNHVTLGAARAVDSPLLRRPDLLASLVTYWQHHPSLSYLFSGAFIGPTSQAPRVDEARDDCAYELGIALEQIASRGWGPGAEADEPWLVDRIFRNLMIDVTGNTHRAEFCIDKLYSPDSAGGRRGLLELRAFEMPPHPRMSLVQMLLLRALVARFWETPYRARPVRWGTALHDRFMLPHFVAEDAAAVVAELRDAGFPFDPVWLDPFLEFRFPRHGSIRADGIELELRYAIEPWNVLGEETSGQGTARYVDSSVERLQVRTTGLASERYLVTCNGRRVPLTPTLERGELVAGVRAKAWDPPSALHPTVPARPKLVFDIIDVPNRKAIAGCTYHVSHPGGRTYETFPVNAAEAESRRVSRFTPHGHTPGPIPLPGPEENPDFPLTLDLRR